MADISRKRKMEQSNSSGDCTKLPKTSAGLVGARKLLEDGTISKHHDFLAYVKKSDKLSVSGFRAASSQADDKGEGSGRKLQLIRLRCSLGDIWHDRHGDPPTSANSKKFPPTGDSFFDVVLSELPYWGFSCMSVLEKGRQGSVILGHANGTGKRVAIKFLSKNLKKKSSIRSLSGGSTSPNLPEEVTILRDKNHPHIVQMLQHLNIRGRLCIVTEFCENGNLEQLLQSREVSFITEPVAKKYMRQMMGAVDYLHSNQIAHRDLKCENWLIDRCNQLKLCGFGCAVAFVCGELLTDDSVGTPGFTAPEILQPTPYCPRKTDIWTLGVNLYHMVTGRLPFPSNKSDVLKSAPSGVAFPSHTVLPLSKELLHTIEGMLCYSPDNRFTLNRVTHGEWMANEDNRVFIGNFHLVRQPQKIIEGAEERALKSELSIC